MPVGSTQLRPHRLAVGLYDLNGENISLRKSVELDVSGDKTIVTELAGEKVADLLLINDRDLSYAKIRFDQKSIITLKAHLGKISDSLTRALCWSAAWDMLRDAEISATDFIEIALTGLSGEDDIATVTTIGSQLTTAVEISIAPQPSAIQPGLELVTPMKKWCRKLKQEVIYNYNLLETSPALHRAPNIMT